MKIGIFGGTGFIRKNLAIFLATNNQVINFTRVDLSLDADKLAEKINKLDEIINLVGAPLAAKRWTKSYKQIIIGSRLEALNKIKQSLAESFGTKAGINIPVFPMKLALGERVEVLVRGQHVFQMKLLNLGFKFQDYDIIDFLNKKIKKV